MLASSLEVMVSLSYASDRHACQHTFVSDPLAVSLALDVLSAVQLLTINDANGSDLAKVVVLATLTVATRFVGTPALIQ